MCIVSSSVSYHIGPVSYSSLIEEGQLAVLPTQASAGSATPLARSMLAPPTPGSEQPCEVVDNGSG